MSEHFKQDRFYTFGFKPTKETQNSHAARNAENSCQYMLPTLVQLAATKPTLRILDVGCGPGSITVSLARYLPEGHIIGVDLSETVLDKARSLAREQGIENVSFQIADAYNLPFEEGSFDLVHAHQTVAHLTEHTKAIRELVRVTRKGGGVICMREGDLHTAGFYPRDPVLEDSFQKFIRVNEMQGGDCDSGRRLKAWTIEAGVPVESIDFTADSFCFHTLEQRRGFNGLRLWQGAAADRAIELGVASREQIEQYQNAWRRWTEGQDSVLVMVHGQVIAHV